MIEKRFSMKRRVKALVLVLVVAMALALSTTVMAADIEVTVTASRSSHSVTDTYGTYPAGSGRLYYENDTTGNTYYKAATGSSGPSYWSGSATVPSGCTGTKAYTMYNGVKAWDYV